MNQISIRYLLGIILLGFQVGMIAYARVHPMRYCCWAPFDSMNHYVIDVELDGHTLSSNEISHRYHLKKNGFDQRAIRHIKDILIAIEQKHQTESMAYVKLLYSTNSHHCYLWRYQHGKETESKVDESMKDQIIPKRKAPQF